MQGQCKKCGREGRIRKGLCDAHYFRLRRNGNVGVPAVAVKTPGAVCSIERCGKPHVAVGYCQMHYTRYRRHGDPSITRKTTLRYGEANSMWRGADVGYHGLHIRVRKALGRASDFLCPCGAQAAEWAYDHGDPNERSSPQGAYSTDLDHYQPMCVRCHRRLDENPIAMGRTTA